jgi:hypothetical protein
MTNQLLATEKSEAIEFARSCRSSWLTRWWTQKNNLKKWMAKEEERHKGLLTPKNSNKRDRSHLSAKSF